MNEETHQSDGKNLQQGQVLLSDALVQSPLQQNGNEGIKSIHNSSQPDKNEFEIKLKFAEEAHQYVREYIRQADQKATFLFAGSSTFLAYLNSLHITSQWISNPKAWGLIEVLSFFATVCLILGNACCAWTVIPRLNGSKKGIVFFEAIQEYENSADYANDLLSKKICDLGQAKFKHIYELSSICRDKYRSLTWGFRLALGGSFCVFALLILK